MADFSAIAIFCDDIRAEKAGTDTIVGVLPDNINVPDMPGIFPRLAVYIRLHIFDFESAPSIKIKIVDGKGELIYENVPEQMELEKIVKSTSKEKVGFLGFLSRVTMTPFIVDCDSTFKVYAEVNGIEKLAGALRIDSVKNADTVISTNASQQPS